MSTDLDPDVAETREWMDALGSVTEFEGTERAGFLLGEFLTKARRVRSLTRWNAVATVLRANKESSELGGHIASYQSSATFTCPGRDDREGLSCPTHCMS